MSGARPRFKDVMRREWWVVAVCLVVALAVGAVVASSASTAYVGSASVTITPGTLTRYAGLATPDQVNAAVTSATFFARAEEELNRTAADLKASTRAYLVGSPAKELVLEYRTATADEARRGALVLAGLAADQALELSSAEITRMKTLVADTKTAIDEISAARLKGDPWQSADLAYKLWDARTELAGHQASLASMLEAYRKPEAASVSKESALAASAKSIIAAGLVGLIVGVGIAALREALLLRRANG